jgi:putative sigma-54 modulation protein
LDAVDVIVRSRNVEVSDGLREHVEKKISKLEKFFDQVQEAQVTLSVEKERHIVEVTVPVNGIILRGQEESSDMYASVDMVVDKLEKQIDKYKTRLFKRFRGNGAKNKPVPETTQMMEETEEGRVVKVKRFIVKPMVVDEAIMQMNLIGHDFFVFFNSDSEDVNVVYKRKDGNYGLIEPQYR